MLLLSVQLAQYIALKPISDKRLILYVITQSVLMTTLWSSYSWLICIMSEGLFFLFVFRYAKKTFLIAWCNRLLMMMICFTFYKGSFHNATWFVPLHITIWPLWVLMIIISIVLRLKWREELAKSAYVYGTQLFTNETTLHLKGYLDSGNLLSWQGIPVIFLKQNYHAYFKDERIELIVMNTVTDTSVLRCYLCEMQMNGCGRHPVYVHCEKNLNLPMGCNVLLNMNVTTMG